MIVATEPKRQRWYCVCFPRVDVNNSLVAAVLDGYVATNRSEAWRKFISRYRNGKTITQMRKLGYRVRCFHLSFEEVE